MKKLLLMTCLVLFAGNALAVELIETWDDPLSGWRDRWVAQNTNMQNYYVCTGGTNEDERGNNPCGIWICDGTANGESIINFEPSFGASIQFFEIGIQAFSTSTLNIYDTGGGLIASFELVQGFETPYGCYTIPYSTATPNGVGRFEIVGGAVEGNTAIDNFRVVTGEPTPVVPTTWSAIKGIYR